MIFELLKRKCFALISTFLVSNILPLWVCTTSSNVGTWVGVYVLHELERQLPVNVMGC